MIIIENYWLERPKPKDSDFMLDHKLAYYSYEKPIEHFKDYSDTKEAESGSATLQDPYGRPVPAAGNMPGDHAYESDGFGYYQPQYMEKKNLESYAKGASSLIIIGSIFNDFILFFLLFASSNYMFGPGLIYGLLCLLISLSAFVAALYLKRLKDMKTVTTIITIYFIIIISEMVLLPIIMAIINVPPQVMSILLSPVLILAIIGFVLTLLSNKYYQQRISAEKDYRQKVPAF